MQPNVRVRERRWSRMTGHCPASHSWGAWNLHGSFLFHSCSSILSILWLYRFLWTKKTHLGSVHAGLGKLLNHHPCKCSTLINLLLQLTICKCIIWKWRQVFFFFLPLLMEIRQVFSFCRSISGLCTSVCEPNYTGDVSNLLLQTAGFINKGEANHKKLKEI